MAAPEYSIHSYFINVDIGDGAVHLLLRHGAVVGAVLIDGGEREAGARVASVIAELRQQYNHFDFNAIVITHWDGDHFRGTMGMIRDDWVRGGLRSSYIVDGVTKFYAPATWWNKVQAAGDFSLAEVGAGFELRIDPNGVNRRLCEFVLSTNCIGYDVFTGLRLGGNTHAQMLNLNAVYQHSATRNLDLATKPIFLCVGCDENFISNDELQTPVESWFKEPKGNAMNASSVMLAALWPKLNPNDPPRIALYTAGDAEEDQEKVFVRWIQDPATTIDVIKPGHHGSGKATPETLLLYKTKAFVVSAADRHGHPSLALLVYLMAYAESRRRALQNVADHPRIYTTRYPYWMYKHPSLMVEKDCNINNLMGYEPAHYLLAAALFNLTQYDYISDWFKDAVRHLKNCYILETDPQELISMDQDSITENRLNPLSLTPILPRDQIDPLDSPAQMTLTREAVCKVLRDVWPLVGEPRKHTEELFTATAAVQIIIKSDGIVGNTLRLDLTPNIQRNQLTAEDYDFIIRSMKRDPGPDPLETRRPKVIEKVEKRSEFVKAKKLIKEKRGLKPEPHDDENAQPGLIMALTMPSSLVADTVAASPISSAEEWALQFFTDDLNKLPSLPQRLEGFPLVAPTSDCYRWFSTYLQMPITLKFDGTAISGKAQVEAIRIETQTGDGSSSLLVFGTHLTSLQDQFGKDNFQGQPMLGFDSRVKGNLFALESSARIAFPDFVKLFHFELSPWVANVLNGIKLVPRPVTNTKPTRSGIWLLPGRKVRTYLRLEMVPDTTTPAISDFEKLLSDFSTTISITDLTFRGTSLQETLAVGGISKDGKKSTLKTTSSLGFEANFKLSSDESALFDSRVGVTLADSGFELRLKMNKSSKLLEKLMEFIQARWGGAENSFNSQTSESLAKKIQEMIGHVAEAFHFHSITLGFSAEKKKLVSFQIDIEVCLRWGTGGMDVPLMASLSWSAGVFVLNGELYNPVDYGPLPYDLNPLREHINEIQPFTDPAADAISITKMLGLDNVVFPAGIPDVITTARIELSYGNGQVTALVEGTLECSPPSLTDDESDPPTILIDELYLLLSVKYGTEKGVPSDFLLRFEGDVSIESAPDHPADNSTINLGIGVEYRREGKDFSQWTIAASVSNVRIANLYELFAQDGSNKAIMDVMSQIVVASAGVTYEYPKQNPGQGPNQKEKEKPSKLAISGTILLGPVALTLNYQHSKDKWGFRATLAADQSLKAEDKEPSLGTLLANLIGDTQPIPEVVRELKIPLDKTSLELGCYSTTVKGTDGKPDSKYVVFCLNITVDKFVATFAQICPYRDPTNPKEKPIPGRLIRFGLSKPPGIEKIPVVDKMPAPFDQLGIVWVNRDITAEEILILNAEAFPVELPLLIRQTSKDSASSTATKKKSTGLVAGCHFQVALNEQGAPTLILDYVPGAKETRGAKNKSQTTTDIKSKGANDDPQPPSASSDSAIAPMAKSIGPLTIRNIGLRVDNMRTIVVVLDASLRLGPITFDLIGFSLSIDLNQAKTLPDLLEIRPVSDVLGMAVAFEKPPTSLAGMFMKTMGTSPQDVSYMGAIAVALGAWSAIAGGVYEEHPDFKSLFVFGLVQGPIAEFGCAEINGVAGGFGYNSRLTLPQEAKEVPEYPFISAITGGPNPKLGVLARLSTLKGTGTGKTYINAVKDSLWLVAGVGIKAFQLIDATAIIALDLSSEPKFGIVAQATAVFPKKLKSGGGDPLEHAFLVLDLSITATVDPAHGLVTAGGELTPRSFILSRSCKLTGGFAMVFFLPGNEHEGDFVFTVGGYHPDFHPPAHYPPAPPHVGISWEYDSEIRISGEAYFAITSTCAMGGGRLDAVIDKGWVQAGFSLYANFFLQFHPFWFDIEIGVSFYASVRIGIGILSIHLGPLEFSASVRLHGPPVAGRATLHLWRWDVAVCFGTPPKQPPKLELGEFIMMVKNQKPDDKTSKPDYLLSITRGAIETDRPDEAAQGMDDPNKTIEIRASQLQFLVQTKIPIKSATINAKPAKLRNDQAEAETIDPQIFAVPMQLRKSMTVSTLTVELTRDGDERTKSMGAIRLIGHPMVKTIPSAIWGPYQDNPADQANASNPEHVMGYTIEIKRAEPSNEELPTFSNIDLYATDVEPHSSKIAPLETPKTNYGFLLPGSETAPTTEDKQNQDMAFKEALNSWKSFKTRYSKGGTNKAPSVPKLLKPLAEVMAGGRT